MSKTSQEKWRPVWTVSEWSGAV